MSDWQSAMREAVDRDEQEQLSIDEARTMRRVVLAAVDADAGQRVETVWTHRAMLVVATVVAIISVGVGAGLRLDLGNGSRQASTTALTADPAPIASETASVDTPSRQLQFMTAGGTRIIWVFNQDLNLKATAR